LSQKYFYGENKVWVSVAVFVGFLCYFMWYFGFKSQMGFVLITASAALLVLLFAFKQIHFPPSGFVVFILALLVLGTTVAFGTQPTPTRVIEYSSPLSAINTKRATLSVTSQQSGNVEIDFSENSSLAYDAYFFLPQFNYIFNFNAYTDFIRQTNFNVTELNATSQAADIRVELGRKLSWNIIVQSNTGRVSFDVPAGSNVSGIEVKTKVGGVIGNISSTVPDVAITTTTGDVTTSYFVSNLTSTVSYVVKTTTGSIVTYTTPPSGFGLRFQARTVRGEIIFFPDSMWEGQSGNTGMTVETSHNFGNATFYIDANLDSVLGNINSTILT
jgi:hypothetical protein